MGNQLFQYAFGKALAVTNGTELGIDLAAFSYDRLRVPELDKFRTSYALPSLDFMSRVAGWPRTRFERVMERILGARTRSRHVYEGLAGYREELKELKSPVYVEGYFQDERYFHHLRPQLLEDLRPRQVLSPETQAMLELARNGNSVSVHVRRGDYVSDPQVRQIFDVLTPEYYANAIQYITRQVTDPLFIVFSDEIAWTKESLRFPPGTIYVEHTSSETAHEDLEIMRNCCHNVIANSSFSWWGAWLAEPLGRIVVAPEKITHRNRPHEMDMIPARWTRLPIQGSATRNRS